MTLYRNTYKLGLGHEAIVTIDEDAPLPAPIGGDWDAEIDHVRASATVILPTDVHGYIHRDLLESNVSVAGAGIYVVHQWGERCPLGRMRIVRLGAETLSDAVAMLRHKVECDLADLAAAVAKRATRLALREERLAFGRARRPPQQELVVRFDVTGMPQGEIAALAAEAVAQGEACEEHPDVTVRVEMPSTGIPMHCVDPTEAPTARIKESPAIPEELDDWNQPVTPRSGPPA